MNLADASTDRLRPGDKHYRAFVGPPEGYDLMAAIQFNLLTSLGLRDSHHLLDIGCGSLRAGRLLIPYLLPGRYCGLEPEEWLVQQGIENEIGRDLVRLKQPVFAHNSAFDLSAFDRKFDFVLAQSIFSHASARQIQTCFQEVSKCLAPSGLMAATFVVGDEDYVGEEWAYPHCVSYTEAGMKRLAQTAGLALRIIDWPHPEQTWMVLGDIHSQERLRDPVSALTKLDSATITVDRFMEQAEGWGYVDEQRVEGRKIHVRGWTRNPTTNLPVKDVLIVDQDRRIVASTIAWVPRKDVAEFFKEPALEPCGFISRFSRNQLRSGSNRLSAYAFQPDSRRAFRLQCSPEMEKILIHVD